MNRFSNNPWGAQMTSQTANPTHFNQAPSRMPSNEMSPRTRDGLVFEDDPQLSTQNAREYIGLRPGGSESMQWDPRLHALNQGAQVASNQGAEAALNQRGNQPSNLRGSEVC